MDTIVEGGHSRIPVYEDSVDNIVGILYAKDLLPYLKGTDQLPPVRRMARAPLFVPESMNVDDLLHSSSGGGSTSRSCSTSTAAPRAW